MKKTNPINLSALRAIASASHQPTLASITPSESFGEKQMKKTNPISDEQDIIRVEMSYRVVRGGSWYRSAERTRSSFRGYGGRSISNYTLGFRLVKNK